jgi:hypothetical protein
MPRHIAIVTPVFDDWPAPSPRSPIACCSPLRDKGLVPISRVLDRITCHRFGKTVLTAWRRPA